MKFTSEDLMKAMGLSIGDEIKIIFPAHTETYIVCKDSSGCIILHEIDCDFEEDLGYLLDQDIEILPRPKRVGDLKCKDCECVECHLRCLPYCNQLDNGKKTLFNTLNSWNEYDTFDQEIHDLLKARLDKVVKE